MDIIPQDVPQKQKAKKPRKPKPTFIPDGQKWCSGCEKFYPATSSCFQFDKSKKDGFATQCKTCKGKYAKQYAVEHKGHIHAYRKQYRIANRERLIEHSRNHYQSHREEILAKDKVQYRLHREKKLSYQRRYRADNRETILSHNRMHYHLNLDESRAKQRAYQSANKERKREQDRRYREKNPGLNARRCKHYYETHREERSQYTQIYSKIHQEKIRNYQRWYRQTHREVKRINEQRRRARKRAVPGNYTLAQVQEQVQRQRYCCYYCGKRFERIKEKGIVKYLYQVEHTFPLSRVVGMGIPANSMDYLVLSCSLCNFKKHNRFPHEWPEGGRLL